VDTDSVSGGESGKREEEIVIERGRYMDKERVAKESTSS
jgi:hypothetical protein